MSSLVRPMCSSDLHEVVRIEHSASAFPWDMGHFRDALRAGYPCLVVEDNQAIVGHAVAAVVRGHACLLSLSVAPEVRGRGHGQALVTRCIESVRACGAEILSLKVAESNHGARRLYSRCGFRRCGLSRGYYPAATGREDALILEIRLADAAAGGVEQEPRCIQPC